MSGLTERLVAYLGIPSEHVLPVGDDDAPEQAAFHGWRFGERTVAGSHTFELYVSDDGRVWLLQFTRLTVTEQPSLRWSVWESLAKAERDLTGTASSQMNQGTTAAPGWVSMRDRLAMLRAQVEP